GGDTTVPDGVITLGEDDCKLPVTQMCGAMYGVRAPDSNRVKQAVGDGSGGAPVDGDWNSLEIGFMSPRFSGETKVRCATVTVKLNGISLFTHLGLRSGTGSQSSADEDINLVQDELYDEGWTQSTGPI